MARTKKLNFKVHYGGTTLAVNDLGLGHSPRFELYDTATKEVIKKSDNPYDFDDIVFKEED